MRGSPRWRGAAIRLHAVCDRAFRIRSPADPGALKRGADSSRLSIIFFRAALHELLSPFLRDPDVQVRRAALEHRQILAPFIDDIGDQGMLDYAEHRHGIRFVSYHGSLEAILKGDDPWLRTCALYVVGARRERSLEKAVEENLLALNPHIRATARGARAALATG